MVVGIDDAARAVADDNDDNDDDDDEKRSLSSISVCVVVSLGVLFLTTFVVSKSFCSCEGTPYNIYKFSPPPSTLERVSKKTKRIAP